MNIYTYVTIGIVGTAVLFGAFKFVYSWAKNKSFKKAFEDTREYASELVETVKSEKFLKLKEKCRNYIYTAEKLYKAYAGKAGMFKLDSVLKSMQVDCNAECLEFDIEYWTEYIKAEVNNMKEVK